MLGPREVILHIGPPKTASTTIQRAIHAISPALRTSGTRTSVDVYQELFRLYKSDPKGRRTSNAVKEFQRVANSLLAQGAERLIVSSEIMAWLDPESIECVLDAFGRDRVRVVFGIRSLAGMIPSIWQEQLKHQFKVDFTDWLEALFGELSPPGSKAEHQSTKNFEFGPASSAAQFRAERFWHANDQGALAHRWSAALSSERVTGFVVDSSRPRSTLENAGAALGLGDQLTLASIERENASLGARSCETLLQLNRSADRRQVPMRIRHMRSEVMVEYLSRNADNSDRLKMPKSYESLVLARQDQILTTLRSEHTVVHGDLGALTKNDLAAYGALSSDSVTSVPIVRSKLFAEFGRVFAKKVRRRVRRDEPAGHTS